MKIWNKQFLAGAVLILLIVIAICFMVVRDKSSSLELNDKKELLIKVDSLMRLQEKLVLDSLSTLNRTLKARIDSLAQLSIELHRKNEDLYEKYRRINRTINRPNY